MSLFSKLLWLRMWRQAIRTLTFIGRDRLIQSKYVKMRWYPEGRERTFHFRWCCQGVGLVEGQFFWAP